MEIITRRVLFSPLNDVFERIDVRKTGSEHDAVVAFRGGRIVLEL